MTDPLRVPEAVREAVREVVRGGCGSPRNKCNPLECPQCADAIARAVLIAALKAEWPGPWKAKKFSIAGKMMWFATQTRWADVGPFDTEAEARSVAAALNITQGGERV